MKKKNSPNKETDALYKAVQKYLEKHGWRVLVIGPTSARKEVGAREYNHEFVVRFVGAKVPPAEAKP